MYLVMIAALALGILFILFSWWIGERKKVIDQFESDVRIFLALSLMISFYLLFLSIALFYLNIVINTGELTYLLSSLYFFSLLLLGVSSYVLLPWLCGKGLQLKDTLMPEPVQKIGDALELMKIPQVYTTPLRIPPLVYGRRKKSSIFVFPENMESFLTKEEQEAVIAHELSHFKQGDIGFFTWLMLLMEGFKYWLLPFPVVMYFEIVQPSIFNLERSTALIFLVPLFFVSMVFLKNSLSRTRESIADAYVIFHGLETPLKRALVKYAALQPQQKSTLPLCFYHETKFKSILATHPPLKKRLHAIDEKTFLTEEATHLSPELAFWVGFVAAFLYYNIMYSILHFSVVVDRFFPVSVEAVGDSILVTTFFAVMGVVGISYIFPSTKGKAFFSNFGNATFSIPLIKNWGITLMTAAATLYGLTIDRELVQIFVPAVLCGFLLWVMGLAASRPTDFSKRTWYLIFSPVFSFILLWYPVRVTYSFFSHSSLDLFHFAVSMLGVILLTLIVFLILMETGHINTDREERLLLLFGKIVEVPHSDAAFVFLAIVLTFSVPAGVSFAWYAVSCLFDTFEILPEMSLLFGLVLILLFYSIRKVDILFFLELSYLADILQEVIHEEDAQFIQNVIEKYQSSDGGFDYAGLHFSNQRDTYHAVRTAKTIKMQLNNEKIAEWITSTKTEGGFALIPGGYPRVEGVYYAVKSLSMLGLLKDVSKTVQWIRSSFKGEYFIFENDTHSRLLQTCYAVESLFLLGALGDLDSCAHWIETHFSDTLKPREAFFASRALKILNSGTEAAEKWLKKNENVLSTRLDKNVEAVYYYVKVLREQAKIVPSYVLEQAVDELGATREKYEDKFGAKNE